METVERAGEFLNDLEPGYLYTYNGYDHEKNYNPLATNFKWSAFDHSHTGHDNQGTFLGYIEPPDIMLFLGVLPYNRSYERYDFLGKFGRFVLQRPRFSKGGPRFIKVST